VGRLGVTETFSELLSSSKSVVRFDDSTSVTTGDLARRGAELAGGLARYVKTGDRIAIWLPSGRTYLELIAACAAGGFVAVNVNARYSAREASELADRSGAALVVTDQLADWRVDLAVLSPVDLDGLAGASTVHQATPEDRFLVFTTSGTTSKPKMVLHTQRSIVRHSQQVPQLFGLGPQTAVLLALPMCGVFGLNSFAAAVAADSPIWVQSLFDAETAAALVEKHQIVAMNGSDDMFHRMLNTTSDLSSLQLAGFGAFNASLTGLAERAQSRGARLSGLYGMSELQALFSFRRQSLDVNQRQLAGGHPASPDYQVRVVDPATGKTLGPESEGELQIKSPSLFAGYLAEGGEAIGEELTASAFSDGWFRTGDLGATSTDGSFRFIARMGDVLRIGGFLVAPAEIEEVVLGLADIDDVQVVAGASESGARPVAFVIADVPVDENAVIEHCRRHLAKFKCPIRVLKVDEFPVTDGPNGVKIQKSKLREMAANALASSDEPTA
jgi:fatty-acyl-CoA synthase